MWRGDTEGERGQNEDEVHGADAGFVVGFGRKYCPKRLASFGYSTLASEEKASEK